ncbi:hypothetical protein VTK73DRAFT_4179 [Phialemonium thermophilum]|uniref:Gem-associated protein 5 TPR domain-containing protein n=1 Tax=Phialemonium thermophilum TaxID=223376 RepID=A0ABR3WUU5_9PEZI
MSSSARLTRSRGPSVNSAMSSGGMADDQEYTIAKNPMIRYLEPCAATASMFLYAQGNSIVCCHHDTLTIERRFSRHSDEIQILAVDNLSDNGRGRLAVSYDASQKAIVWDILTGDVIAQFAPYEYKYLTCAAWMHNGNVAFGDSEGSIIQFEHSTAEHLSARTLDQIPVTALAPAADCRTFAIGYQNGSLLIATLQPKFTILHNLSTRRPSAIVNLAWHASSSRQKANMLAVQTNDGEIRVWSVSKTYSSDDPAKIVRILERTPNFVTTGPNWMGWSKNGRIIQFSENETISWDVRTRQVTSDRIPTLEHVRGLAVYGPSATLFTLGANNTVQQFDLNAPSRMVINVQHPANLLPPSPPISLEEQDKGTAASASESESISVHMTPSTFASEDDGGLQSSTLARRREADSDADEYRAPSDMSSHSSVSVSSTSSRTPGIHYTSSMASRGMSDATYISTGSSIRYLAIHPPNKRERDSYSTSSLSSISMTSSHNKPRHNRPSRLRHEVESSPGGAATEDLFRLTRSRLSDVPYKKPVIADSSRLTNDDLRRQMLSTIFGWNREVEDLIYEEMSRHPVGSVSRILLSRWLGINTTEIMTSTSQSLTQSDWMLVVLSMGGKLDRAVANELIRKLLQSGDINTAATMSIGIGDANDAIEIYISHKRYMEALLLACLFFPGVWERQEAIIKKWGEWAVQHGQQQLALRCFACTGKESTEPWRSPSAAQVDFRSLNAHVIPEVLSPPLSLPDTNVGPQRSIAKSASLKLITSFGNSTTKAKFYSGGDDGRTPIAAAVTPIATSALSPTDMYGEDLATAVLNPSQRSAFNTPASARAHGFGRQRLPSIGETPNEASTRNLLARLQSSQESSSSRPNHSQQASVDEKNTSEFSIPRAATASPAMMKDSHRRRDPPPPSPSPASLAALTHGPPSRNGPRSRIPDGVKLNLPAVEPASSDVTSPETSVASSNRFHWPSRRRGPGSVASSVTSGASSTAKSRRGHHGGVKSIDDYVHSLDAAQSSHRVRASKGSHTRDSSQTRKTRSREGSRERGRPSSRTAYTPKGPKRSPTSPIPMSPEELINLSTPSKPDTSGEISAALFVGVSHEEAQPQTVRKSSRHAARESSQSRVSSRASSRDGRRRSPNRRPTPKNTRERSTAREGSIIRSPSSPLPMSKNQLSFDPEEEEDLRLALEQKEKFRRQHSRPSSRGIADPISPISSVGKTRERSVSRHGGGESKRRTPAPTPTPSQQAQPTGDQVGDLRAMKDERQLKKEAAARELEERRKSLASRPSAPPIPHPDDLHPSMSRTPPQGAAAHPTATHGSQSDLALRNTQSVEPGPTRSMYAHRGPQIGLPATPKAMRLVLESDNGKSTKGPVPPIPVTFAQATSPDKATTASQEHKEDPPATLTLLPSTVYSPPSRQPIPRSMSAPPEDISVPRTLQGGGHTLGRGVSRRQSLRKGSVDSSAPQEFGATGGRPSYDEKMPPPPRPPLVKELQHLATPPPPPPAPVPHGVGSRPVVYGGQTSGTIEIVMDNNDQMGSTMGPLPPPPRPPSVPVAIPVSEATVPIIAPPAPPASRNGHHRGRSSVDNSIAGRISRATERMRSASRGRNNPNRTKSPETGVPAPYESISPPPVSQQGQHEFRTGLHRSEMI